jgi:hypothetical protein
MAEEQTGLPGPRCAHSPEGELKHQDLGVDTEGELHSELH